MDGPSRLGPFGNSVPASVRRSPQALVSSSALVLSAVPYIRAPRSLDATPASREELPDGLPCDFIEEEPEWITAKRRRCDQLEAETTDLRSRVVALEVEVVVTQLVADRSGKVASQYWNSAYWRVHEYSPGLNYKIVDRGA